MEWNIEKKKHMYAILDCFKACIYLEGSTILSLHNQVDIWRLGHYLKLKAFYYNITKMFGSLIYDSYP